VPNADLTILVWNDHWLGAGLEEPISITTRHGAHIELRFIRDRKLQASADAVLLHGPTIRDLPRKMPGQPWVMVSMEAYANYPLLTGAKKWGIFELTMTHQLDADIPIPYAGRGQFQGLLGQPRPPKQPSALVCFIASHAVPSRDAYVSELMKYAPVDSYGSRLNNRRFEELVPAGSTRADEAQYAIASYPFYLAFENCRETDYVTEKLFRPLSLGTVPLYWGAPNVSEFLPSPDAAIVLDDISPRDLASLLTDTAADPASLAKHLAWRSSPSPSFERLRDLSDVDGRARLGTKLAHGCERDCWCGGRQR
jgi:hypothetical protein